MEMVDLSPFVHNGTIEEKQQTAELIRKICKQSGFFYLKGHGVSEKLQEDIIKTSSDFFKRPLQEKN